MLYQLLFIYVLCDVRCLWLVILHFPRATRSTSTEKHTVALINKNPTQKEEAITSGGRISDAAKEKEKDNFDQVLSDAKPEAK